MTEMREGLLFATMGLAPQHMWFAEGLLSLSTLMLPLVDTRTTVTGCAPVQLKENGREIS